MTAFQGAVFGIVGICIVVAAAVFFVRGRIVAEPRVAQEKSAVSPVSAPVVGKTAQKARVVRPVPFTSQASTASRPENGKAR